MKKKLWIVILVGITLGMGCKKFLTTEPKSFLSPEEYYSTDNIKNALAGVYNPLITQQLYSSYYWSTLRATTDEQFYGGGRTLTTGIDVYNFDYGNAIVAGLWEQLYVGIERANEFFKYVDTSTSASNKAMYGECLFLRGYYYYLLVANFGGVPLKITATETADNLSVAKSSVKEVYDQIISDMTAAEGLVYEADVLGYSSRVSKTTVEGILARVCLSMAGAPLNDESQYANALSWSKKVIQSGKHSLNKDYRKVFINEAQGVYDIAETMWEADFSYDAEAVGGTYGGWVGSYSGIQFNSSATTDGSNYQYSDTGYCYAFLWGTRMLWDLYSPSDYRKDWNLGSYTYGVSASTGGIVYRTPIADTFKYDRPAAKWRRNYEKTAVKNKNLTAIDFPILRYSDVLLMFAEAELHVNGSTADALDAINQVRLRGYGLTLEAGKAPAKNLTLLDGGSGYSGSSFNQGDDNMSQNLAYTTSVSSGKITTIKTLLNGGYGYTDGDIVTLGNVWYANYYYAASTKVVYNGNLYTVSGAGITSSTPPTQTSGSSTATLTGIVFAYAGKAATAQVTTVKESDIKLTSLTLQDIIDERARELCFEGLRTLDLIRWGLFISNMKTEIARMNTQVTLSKNTNRAQNILGYSNVSDRNLLLPIPSSEMNVNKLMKQNPGW